VWESEKREYHRSLPRERIYVWISNLFLFERARGDCSETVVKRRLSRNRTSCLSVTEVLFETVCVTVVLRRSKTDGWTN
jgi:hypothetical protein